LPPLAAIRASTVLCSQTFIFAESPINSVGQPNSVANSLRAAKLLSSSRSLRRSTIEVRQFNFWGFAAARCSSRATTSTRGTALSWGSGEEVGAPGCNDAASFGGEGEEGALPPIPSLSRILLKNPINTLLSGRQKWPIRRVVVESSNVSGGGFSVFISPLLSPSARLSMRGRQHLRNLLRQGLTAKQWVSQGSTG